MRPPDYGPGQVDLYGGNRVHGCLRKLADGAVVRVMAGTVITLVIGTAGAIMFRHMAARVFFAKTMHVCGGQHNNSADEHEETQYG